MNKTLLIVGDGDHQFIYNYVKWLKKKGDFSRIDILTNNRISDHHSYVYSHIYTIFRDSNIYRFLIKIKVIRRIYRFYLYRNLINKLPKYDFVHVHFMNVDNIYIAERFKNCKKILSIWGSDYYRANISRKRKLIKVCNISDIITFTNEVTLKSFLKEFCYNKNNLKICRFGLAPLEYLENFPETKINSKEKLGWDRNKISITIGYNLSMQQQHIQIIQQIENLKNYSHKIELILPITYSKNDHYKVKLISILKESQFSYKYYDEFLDDNTICRIRNASDVMIQLQTTDQFSGSMQEYLFTRNVVITGSWLPYKTMKDHGVWFIEIDAISELEGKLSHLLNNFNECYQKTNENPKAIINMSTWDRNIESWLSLYN